MVPEKFIRPLACLICMLVVLLIYTQVTFPDEIEEFWGFSDPGPEALSEPELPAANSTLGFGAVIAVSTAKSARRAGLIAAANLTGLDITIPYQPKWSPEQITTLKGKEGSSLTRGSAMAWLGHLNALKWFLSTDLQTALFIEDDVDWDIRLRTSQIPAAARALRKLSNASLSTSEDYWGGNSAFDLLYLGHCGDIFPASQWTKNLTHTTYPDETLPSPSELHPYTRKFLQSIHIPAQTRAVHKTLFPLCTFGYALTRDSAERMVEKLAAREPEGGTIAYDVRVHEICRDTRDFKCLTVNPELMHHMDAASEIGGIDEESNQTQGGMHKQYAMRASRATPNIERSARKQG